MSSKATVSLTVGSSGSGKTYYRCSVFLIDEWLPFHNGLLICNYPINMDNLLADYPDAGERVEIIPEDVLKAWREGRSGPWDYLSSRDISGCHIAIDEIHNYCGSASDIKIRRKWQQFVGELRHRGATIEFLTQAEAKCSKELLAEAEIRYEIQNGENRRVPILGYRYGDLYELRAKLIGKYLAPSFCLEKTQADGGWHNLEERCFFRLPSYFKYYNSFSAPMSGGEKGNVSEKHPYEKYNWLQLIIWFFFQYPFRIPIQIGMVSVFVWFFFCGGMTDMLQGMFKAFQGASSHVVKSINQSEDSSKVSTVDESSKSLQNTSSFFVKINKLEFVSSRYFRYSGKVYNLGDDYYGKITQIHKDGFFVDDLIFVPFGWLDEME